MYITVFEDDDLSARIDTDAMFELADASDYGLVEDDDIGLPEAPHTYFDEQ